MPRLLQEESGFTLVELVVVCVITVVLAGGLSNLFISGLRVSSTANATLSSQSNVMYALSRIEFESRCASSAALVSGGAGVTLTLPTFCANAHGTYTWCVTSGSLVRYSTSACSGSGETFAASVTSATPFSCIDTGNYPRLQVALTANAGATPSNTSLATAATGTATITLRNASTSDACA